MVNKLLMIQSPAAATAQSTPPAGVASWKEIGASTTASPRRRAQVLRSLAGLDQSRAPAFRKMCGNGPRPRGYARINEERTRGGCIPI
jgi:hypothetical protein